jgi:hypothetical protein
MRNHPLPSIPSRTLATVVGGCHKHGCAQPSQMAQPAQAQAPDPGPRASITVATGQAGGQAIQQALGGGAAPVA